jgi:hypothetical protein
MKEPIFDVTPLKFFDRGTDRECMYVYPATKHWCAGWLLFKAKNGEWITWRKATDADIEVMSAAVIAAHHGERVFA